MKTNTIYSHYLLALTCSLFIYLDSSAQQFRRIENEIGLGILEENSSVAVADYDGDFDLDVFIVAKSGDINNLEKSFSRLFRNDNGFFTDVTESSGLLGLYSPQNIEFSGMEGEKFGASWGDYDNDGFPDLFLTYVTGVQLFRNKGNGSFENATNSSGIEVNETCRNMGATWFDYDKDGFLDIYINDWGGCDGGGGSLFRNNGNGTFGKVVIGSGINDDGSTDHSFSMIPFDFNKDGLLDLYVSIDFSDPNNLYENHVGSGTGNDFLEKAADYGLDSRMDDMGMTFGDFDNDQDFDIFITGVNETKFFENDGNNLFSNASNLGIFDTKWAWGCEFADFDLDGDEDLFVANGDAEGKIVSQNFYYKNLLKEGIGGFKDDTFESALVEITDSREVVSLDFDNDGHLDIFLTNLDQSFFVYENNTNDLEQNDNLNWLKVSLIGTDSNRDGLGAEVSITTDGGVYSRHYSGVGFIAQSLLPIHFGLNESVEVNTLQIKWPSGYIQTINDLEEVNVTVIVTEGVEEYEIYNPEKIYGCTDPNSCSFNPLATVNDGSCIITLNDIRGANFSGFGKTETYSLDLDSEFIEFWKVENGEIISGEGTNIITVKWGLSETGKVSLKEKNTLCQGDSHELVVNLSVTSVPDNISVARIWNEALLEAIRGDFARPTVHARNLFHTSVAMYDAWAIYDTDAKPYLIGNTVHNFSSELKDVTPVESVEESQNKAISYAAYRILTHRFQSSPSAESSLERFDLIMSQLGYDTSYTSSAYESGNAADLGNYIGQILINFGLTDNSNEINDYENNYYAPTNPPIELNVSEKNTGVIDPNRWQPLTFDTFIDQSGNQIIGSTPEFLGPEWGNVLPFALSDDDKSVYQRDGDNYTTYHAPSTPPQLDLTSQTESSKQYLWNFSLVSLWSSHLDPTDGVSWDISPKSIGNIDINLFPSSFGNYDEFYNYTEGGDISIGHSSNPVTGKPYETQMVPRADYARVLAEFWADGPDSETPPGHWFTILNYVSDHPLFEKKFNGQGEKMNPLEWDIKSYFILAGAMHDSAVTAWGIKGWVDYIRPISAIRYMSELGQSTDENLANYNVAGIPLVDGFIEIIEEGDPLEGDLKENIGEIKLYAWNGHDFISNSETDVAGVGWIMAKNWWPYQRPSFVTPPFAGYISGHSTFSRAAAEVMTLITGDEFFPGGMGEFVAKKDEFLVFEKGPSVDVTLQWATYRDASDQTSLSRIWGGIHPPADDIPGRIIGEQIGVDTYNFAIPYFHGKVIDLEQEEHIFYPSPLVDKEINITKTKESDSFSLFDMLGRKIEINEAIYNPLSRITLLKFPNNVVVGLYVLRVNNISTVIIVSN